jgi:regulator of sirC expression with transglutaminase-like and TPR domain
MQTGLSSQRSVALSESQRNALISLLADDDPSVYRTIRHQLLSYGRDAAHWLRPHLLSADPVLRRRALEIVSYFARQNNDEAFLAFCLTNGEELDLEQGTGLLARTQYPDVNLHAYQALYDHWAHELRERVDPSSGAEQILRTINHYLFEELGFHGNDRFGDDPRNCYLNHVVDQRSGNPISLSVVYLFVGRRLHLPLTGIGLPGHFICRYQSPTQELYIDCFRGGKFWTKADCIRFLVQTNHTLQEGHLAPVSSRRMLLRMCASLHQTYSSLEMREEANRVQRYLVALAK